MSGVIMRGCASFGCERFGRLTRVMLHRPGDSLRAVNDSNHKRFLFDRVPDVDRFNEEHDRYRKLLESLGVEVVELADHVLRNRSLLERRPNLTYLHDIAVVSSFGAMLSKMAWEGRRGEEHVVREALSNMGIPIAHEFSESDGAFEGCLLLSEDTVLVADTERHSTSAIWKFTAAALRHFREVIYVEVPKERRYMHPDCVFNRIGDDLALVHLPAFRSAYLWTDVSVCQIDFATYMRKRGVELIDVSDSEQRRLATSFVPLEPGAIIHYDTALDGPTIRRLSRRGVELIPFHPDALTAGGGSLRCLTLRLHRRAERRAAGVTTGLYSSAVGAD